MKHIRPLLGKDMTRVFVHLKEGLDARAWRTKYESGDAPDASPYGFHHASELGFDLSFSEDFRSNPITFFVQRALRKLLGFDLIHAFRNRKRMMDADVIWTMLDPDALAVAAMMRMGLIPQKPVIAATVWMINRWDDYNWFHRRLYAWLAGAWSVMTVHAEPCLARSREILPDIRCELVKFGIAEDTFSSEPLPERPTDPIQIVAAGNDRTRDWDVLLRAFGDDPRFKLVIICQWLSLDRAYSNVELAMGIDVHKLKSLYKSATYVAVTMKENLFSGITVALEAAALGVPLLSSRTGGVPTYFSEEEVLYARPEDPENLRAVVLAQSAEDRYAMAARAKEKWRAADYSTRGMIGRYAALTRTLIPALEPAGNE